MFNYFRLNTIGHFTWFNFMLARGKGHLSPIFADLGTGPRAAAESPLMWVPSVVPGTE